MTDVATRRRAEVRALARLAFDELGGATGGIGSMHRAISDRVFGLVGRGTGTAHAPVKAVHDGITDVVYAGVSSSLGLAGLVAGRTLDVTLPAAPSETTWGAGLIGVIQGLRGDTLAADEPLLAGPMTIRQSGAAVGVDRASLADAFPDARSHVVVFVHGLMESENAWRLGGRPTYGDRLAAEVDCTPLYIRYNTGLHISENARLFTDAMTDLYASWPVPIDRISLVGHSMGGLVLRGGCHLADTEGSAWVRAVRHIVCLGSPHFGAPLARLVHIASAGLVAVPETAPLGRLLRRRSNGVRDLRAGSLVDADWRDLDKDALKAAVATEVPLLTGVTHCFVSATVTRSPRHPLGRLLGDGLVTTPSASGRSRTRRVGFSEEHGLHVGGASHFALLNNDAVYDATLRWLTAESSEL